MIGQRYHAFFISSYPVFYSQPCAVILIRAAILAKDKGAHELGFKPDTYEDVLHRDLFLAAEILADDVMVNNEFASDVAQELCRGLSNTCEYYTIKNRKGYYIGSPSKLHEEYSVHLKEIMKGVYGGAVSTMLLEHSKIFMKNGCKHWIEPLIQKYDQQSLQLMLSLIRTSKDLYMAEFVSDKLKLLNVESEYVVESLLSLINEMKNNESVQINLAEALAKLGRANYARELLRKIGSTSNRGWVLLESARALLAFGDKRSATKILMGLARKEKDGRLGLYVAEELNKIGKKGNSISLLIKITHISNDGNERQDAAESLIEMGEKDRAAKLLIEIARTAEDEYFLCKAVETLEGLGYVSNSILSGLKKLIRSSKWQNGKVILSGVLGRLGNKADALQVLMQLIPTIKEEYILCNIYREIGRLGDKEEAIQLFIKLLQETRNKYTRLTVAEELADLGAVNDSSVALSKLNHRADNRFCFMYAETLIRLNKVPQARSLLHELIVKSKDNYWRHRAIETLGNLHGIYGDDINILLQIARSDKNFGIQDAAYVALNKMIANVN